MKNPSTQLFPCPPALVLHRLVVPSYKPGGTAEATNSLPMQSFSGNSGVARLLTGESPAFSPRRPFVLATSLRIIATQILLWLLLSSSPLTSARVSHFPLILVVAKQMQDAIEDYHSVDISFSFFQVPWCSIILLRWASPPPICSLLMSLFSWHLFPCNRCLKYSVSRRVPVVVVVILELLLARVGSFSLSAPCSVSWFSIQ